MSPGKQSIPRSRGVPAARRLLVGLVLLSLAACSLPWRPGPTPAPSAAPPPPAPSPRPSGLPPAVPAPTALPDDLFLSAEGVTVFPGPQRYSGDWITFDVRPEGLGAIEPGTLVVRVYEGAVAPERVIAEGRVDFVSFDGVSRARLAWAWDTAGLVGEQTLVFWVDPDDAVQDGDEDPGNNLVTYTLELRPAAELPPREAAADWVSTTTSCCLLYYLDDTSAGRDMPEIIAQAEAAAAEVEARLGVSMPRELRLYFLDRVIGHGGYAYDAVALSYVDRHYAGANLPVVLRHEATHVIDTALFQEGYAPTILREGLATYMGGGHYKPEPIPQRAAALLELGWYVPLERLAEDFYRQQHEAGYLQGAGLVAFLADTYGWERFLEMYGSFPGSGGRPAQVLDAALQRHMGQGLAQVEVDFVAWLREHAPTPTQIRDLEDTVLLFDTIRRYQALLDPSAYWMSGFLPNPTAGAERGIVADFARNPRAPENVALETMLVAARTALEAGDLARCEMLVEAVNRVLDGGGWAGTPEADYMALVTLAAAAGYEAQQIELNADAAHVQAIAAWPLLEALSFRRTASGWALAQ